MYECPMQSEYMFTRFAMRQQEQLCYCLNIHL